MIPMLSFKAVHRQRRDFQLGVTVSLTFRNRSWICIVLGFSACAFRPLLEALLVELQFDDASAASSILLEYLS